MTTASPWRVLLTLAALSACAPPTAPETLYKPSRNDLAKARDHEYDGRYIGKGTVANGFTCFAARPQWTAMLTVDGNRFELTPWIYENAARAYRGNVAPNGVLTRFRVFIGRIEDGKFTGGLTIDRACRLLFDLPRETPASRAEAKLGDEG